MLSTSQNRPRPWLAFLLFALITLIQFPAAFLIQNYSLTAGILINETLFIVGLSFWVQHHYQIPFLEIFPLRKPEKKALFWVAMMTLALAVIIDDLMFLSEKIWPVDPRVEMLLEKVMTVHSVGEGLWRWFLICWTPAFCEEIFFRGFFQNTLQNHWGRKTALILTATAFAAIHSIPQYIHLYLILGFFLSWVLMIGGNLWYAMLAHLINNSWTFIGFLLHKNVHPVDKWVPLDNFVLAASLFIFGFAAFRFASSFQRR